MAVRYLEIYHGMKKDIVHVDVSDIDTVEINVCRFYGGGECDVENVLLTKEEAIEAAKAILRHYQQGETD